MWEDLKCFIHGDVEAAGACTQCGRGLCPQCALNVDGKMVCRECVERMASKNVCAPARKEPFLAAVLSLIGGVLTGSLLFSLGQLYNGQVKKFIVFTLANLSIGIIAAIIYLVLSFATIGIGFVCCLPVFALPFVLYLYEVYDAYVIADKINRGEPVKDMFD
jgi:uncharacterized membrane protein